MDKSREISHIRIHVERVIGLLKLKYKIIKTVLPVNLVKSSESCTIDEIVIICAALCPLVVPLINELMNASTMQIPR